MTTHIEKAEEASHSFPVLYLSCSERCFKTRESQEGDTTPSAEAAVSRSRGGGIIPNPQLETLRTTGRQLGLEAGKQAAVEPGNKTKGTGEHGVRSWDPSPRRLGLPPQSWKMGACSLGKSSDLLCMGPCTPGSRRLELGAPKENPSLFQGGSPPAPVDRSRGELNWGSSQPRGESRLLQPSPPRPPRAPRTLRASNRL